MTDPTFIATHKTAPDALTAAGIPTPRESPENTPRPSEPLSLMGRQWAVETLARQIAARKLANPRYEKMRGDYPWVSERDWSRVSYAFDRIVERMNPTSAEQVQARVVLRSRGITP